MKCVMGILHLLEALQILQDKYQGEKANPVVSFGLDVEQIGNLRGLLDSGRQKAVLGSGD